MERSEFVELAKNDMPNALIWLFDQLEAAELTVSSLLSEED